MEWQFIHRSNKLRKERTELFHSLVAKRLFISKRADIFHAITYLCTRVKEQKKNDFFTLIQVLGFLKSTINDKLPNEANDYDKISRYFDGAFGVHNYLKSHTGSIMMIERGSKQSISTKQKEIARSSTEAQLDSMYDAL